MIHDQYVTGVPTPQNMINLVPGWVSKLPDGVSVDAGQLNLFADTRVDWVMGRLGGVWGDSILELGPLEAGHTYQLIKSGARSVVSIEANQLAFIRCLIVKELLGLTRASFLLGDFASYLAETSLRYDVVWASGVLYHMPDPVSLLVSISKVSDKVFLWTHYVDDDEMPLDDPRRAPIVGEDIISWRGHDLKLYRRTYFDGPKNANFTGGISSEPAWMEREGILLVLRELGYTEIEILPGDPNHSAGPNFCVLATR